MEMLQLTFLLHRENDNTRVGGGGVQHKEKSSVSRVMLNKCKGEICKA